ncbi:hypothetical protein B0H12DRAFT_1238820 [Mycena haematopus]|nr:hypothetical protein B0H12DRAFT_1238820 [Mycena haematopus]
MQQAKQIGDLPHRDDALAYYTFCALAPRNGTLAAVNHQYRLFFTVGIGLFSIRGLYAHIARLGHFEQASHAMAHYPYPTDNITMFLVAAWFIQHGIAPESAAVHILEDFARVRRNMQNSIESLENEMWADDPRDARVLAMTSDDIPQWTELHHAPPIVLPTASTSTGLTASMHAPMEDVAATHTSPTPPLMTSAPAPVADTVPAPF